ncbi:hypothetical protein QUA35_24100 [Microcoleus sp. N9_B2]|uniref:hypothetical protein n=1 Tax=unclassified Microcoleus TaxID=2642155 RepID=UPI002FD1B8CB
MADLVAVKILKKAFKIVSYNHKKYQCNSDTNLCLFNLLFIQLVKIPDKIGNKPLEKLRHLPERIGLKPLYFREKLKENYSLLQSSSF